MSEEWFTTDLPVTNYWLTTPATRADATARMVVGVGNCCAAEPCQERSRARRRRTVPSRCCPPVNDGCSFGKVKTEAAESAIRTNTERTPPAPPVQRRPSSLALFGCHSMADLAAPFGVCRLVEFLEMGERGAAVPGDGLSEATEPHSLEIVDHCGLVRRLECSVTTRSRRQRASAC